MTTTKLTNSFHGTETTVRLTEAEMARIEALAFAGDKDACRYMRRVKARLCVVAWCKCSDGWGQR